jgi:chromosome segregation ATPase
MVLMSFTRSLSKIAAISHWQLHVNALALAMATAAAAAGGDPYISAFPYQTPAHMQQQQQQQPPFHTYQTVQGLCSPMIGLSPAAASHDNSQYMLHRGASTPPPAQSIAAGAQSAVFADAQLRDLVMSKERELHEIHELRSTTLERTLADREGKLVDVTAKLTKLREDFKYNLTLIEGRDAELERFEVTLDGVRSCLRDKEVEANELRRQLDEMAARSAAAHAREDEQTHYWREKCKNLRCEADNLKWSHEDDMRKAREVAEGLRAEVARHSRLLEDELEVQRRDMTVTFDDVMRQRDDELKQRQAEFSAQLLEHKQAVSDAKRETDRARADAVKLQSELAKQTEALAACQRALRTKQWEYEDAVQSRQAEAASFEGTCAAMKAAAEQAAAVAEDRVSQLMTSLHAVESAFVQHKAREIDSGKRTAAVEGAMQTARARETQLLKSLTERTAELQAVQVEAAQLQSNCDDLTGTKSALQHELSVRNSELELLKTARTDSSAKAQQLQAKLQAYENSANELKAAAQNAQLHSEQLQADVEEARTELAAALSAKQSLEAALTELHTELVQQESAYEQQSRVLVSERAELQAQLRDAVRSLSQLKHESKQQQQQHQKHSHSPVFSDDMGDASPLPSHIVQNNSLQSNSLQNNNKQQQQQQSEGFNASGNSVNAAATATATAAKVHELEATNQRLRGVITEMRREVSTAS